MQHRPDRYTTTAIALHWVIAVVVVSQFTWGWWMQEIAKEPPGARADAFNVHKSIGLTLLALMMFRLFWRWRHPVPRLPVMAAWEASLARFNHFVLYVTLFAMPLTGYLGSVFSGYPVKYFGVTLPGWGWEDSMLKDAFSSIHYMISWVLAGAVVLHVTGALKHACLDRDGLLARMGIGNVKEIKAETEAREARF